jgi:hypothetical protein
MSGTIPIYSRFIGDDRVSIYDDESVEIQHGGRAYRATIARWVESAEMVNALARPAPRIEGEA